VKHKVKRISTIELKHEGVIAVVAALKKEIFLNDIILKRKSFNSGERDFRPLLGLIKKEEPDILFICAFPPELELIAKQAKDLGITTPISTIEAFDMTEELGLFEGCWYVSGSAGQGKKAEGLRTKLNIKFGQERFYCAGFAYDSIQLLSDAFDLQGKKGGGKDAAMYLKMLKNYPGVSGILNVDEEGVILSPASLKIIKNGKIEVVK
jgi:branched-chain amino acid transport system substrate-binding protein